jgi:polysaccharide export outer membrane protein
MRNSMSKLASLRAERSNPGYAKLARSCIASVASFLAKTGIPILIILTLSGCGSFNGFLSSSGPSAGLVKNADNKLTQNNALIQVIPLDTAVTQKIQESDRRQLFSEIFPTQTQNQFLAKPGDVIEVNIWESNPPLLFGTNNTGLSSMPKNTVLPDQMINSAGYITIPFAGKIKAAGKSTSEIENSILEALAGKANYPQVLVRMTRNTLNATVVGEVSNSILLALTPKGEKILDAIAAAGGVKQPINKITLQLSRGKTVQSIPLDTIIQDPSQNIYLMAGDVLTAFFQPLSFTVLGATGKNDEINFEGQGISLAQALGRVGGLDDNRANSKGVFIFRFEDPSSLLDPKRIKSQNKEGKVPVIYLINLNDPSTFFVMQNFPIKNRDVLYVSNAPATELQKFLNIMVSAIYPVVNAGVVQR